MNALYYLYNRSGRFGKSWKMGRANLEVILFKYIDSAADVAAKRNFKVK